MMGPKIGGFLALIGFTATFVVSVLAIVISDSTSLFYTANSPVSVAFIVLGTMAMTLLVAGVVIAVSTITP